MNWAAVLAIGGILFLIALVYQPLEYYGSGAGSSDLNEMDANSLYVQKNPLTAQTINGFGLDINNSSAVDATLDVRNNGGASVPIIRSWTGSSQGFYLQDFFGFPGWLCPSGRLICFFGIDNFGAYFALTTPSSGKSAFNSTAGFDFQGGGEVSVTNADLKVIGTGSFFSDKNVNALDLNVSRNSNIQNLRVANDANFFQNARIVKDLYVDKNIYADTYEKDAGLALDTCYTNGGKRDMHIYGSIETNLKLDNDIAYVDLQTGVNCGTLITIQRVGVELFGVGSGGVNEVFNYPFSFLVHDGNAFQITSTIAGSGIVTLDYSRSYYP